jgi:CheY-like chemotaxis protein
MTMASRQPSVLVLASDGLTRQTTATCLETFGYDVVSAPDGVEAVSLLRQNRRIGVIVTEADLGGEVDGLAVAKTARELNPKMAVIYTARSPHSIPQARKVSGAPMLRSPYFPQQIVGIIGELRGRSTYDPVAA